MLKTLRSSLTALVSALAAMLLLVTPAQAAMTDLQQGQYIRAGGNLAYCSLTVTEGNIGYTAWHCSGGEWTVGSLISDKNGRPIGRISAMRPGFDVVKIKLNPKLTLDGVYPKRDYNSLTPGEPIYVRGLGRSYPAGQFTGAPLVKWLDYEGVAAQVTPSTVEEGTSGGAALDAHNNLVGVNVGEVYDILPSGEFVNYRETFIPWNVIDSYLG